MNHSTGYKTVRDVSGPTVETDNVDAQGNFHARTDLKLSDALRRRSPWRLGSLGKWAAWLRST
jgi:hypothetical protein